jgi:hypothetical protein
MAVEAYLVAFDIQHAGPGYAAIEGKTFIEKLGAGEKVKIAGAPEFEGKGSSNGSNGEKSGLLAHQGGNVVTCKMVELEANTAAEAVEVVRQKYAQNAGGERAVVKPNETNFRVVN